jgi:hypothetical protein
MNYSRPLWTLRKQLKYVLGTIAHNIINFTDKLDWHLLMEQVTHRADEYAARLSPVKGFFKVFFFTINRPIPLSASDDLVILP